MNRPVIELEEGWPLLAAGMAKFRRAVEAHGEEARITADEILNLYNTAYNMCTQKTPYQDRDHYMRQLYERYKEDVDSYNKSTVLPPLKEMQGEILLRHLVQAWRKHRKIFKSCANTTFLYLDNYYVTRNSLPTIKQVAYTSFHELVLNELADSVTDTVISMINDEREGKLVDRDLLKDVLDIYVEIGSGNLDTYQVAFERAFCESTRNYYANKAQINLDPGVL